MGLGLIAWTGTMDNPIMVKSAGNEQYAGCTGFPADSHVVVWVGVRTNSLYLPSISKRKF